MRREIKTWGSTLLDRAGLVRLMLRAVSSRGGFVLALHRVLPLQELDTCYNPHLVLSEPAFISLLQFLQQDYSVVPLETLLAEPKRSGGRPKVAITFDDGWEDNYRVVFPHLLAYQMPVTIFLCTDLVGTDAVLPEERFARLWKRCEAMGRLASLTADFTEWGMGRTAKTGAISRSQWSEEFKRVPMDARLLLLDHFEERYKAPKVTTTRFMGWDDVRIMMNTGLVQFGSHTGRHVSLTSETDREIRRELETSREMLASRTGSHSSAFAYPNGMYDSRVASVVRSVGFTTAVSTDFGAATRKSNPMAIPRIAIDDTTVSDTHAQLSTSRTEVYFVRSALRPSFAF